VTFNNGDVLTADDVMFAFTQWLDKEIASTMRTLFAPILSDNGVEKVNDYQVKLHLNKPDISVPFYLTEARGTIVNSRTFEGDILKAPHGTGPYLLEYYAAGERVSFKRRNDYWQKGVDGDSMPYLDGLEFIDMGSEGAPKMAAIRSGDIDCIDLTDVGGVEYYSALKEVDGITTLPSPSGYCNVMRMRADIKPFDDERVRLALKLCQHREKILGLAYYGQGLLGHDTHIFPKAAAYCKKPIPKYDPERAKALLKQAGYPNGVDITMNIPGDVTEIVRFGEILQEDAAQAGFRMKLETMPSSQYWEKWTEVGLGVTAWAHRDSDTQVFNQAYTVDEDGKPVPWNESRWVDQEFIGLLKQANGTLDVDQRRKILCKLEDIQMTRGTVGISYFANGWFCVRSNVKGININPQRRMIQPGMWMDQSA
jgi:peptide/nickel transport system substrate-binding protein